MTGRSAVLVAMALGIVAIGATAGSKATPRFVWNVSGSVPTGLYRVHPAGDLWVNRPHIGWTLAEGLHGASV